MPDLGLAKCVASAPRRMVKNPDEGSWRRRDCVEHCPPELCPPWPWRNKADTLPGLERGVRPAEEGAAERSGSIPIRRSGRPEEYLDVVTVLVSDRASYVTRSVIRVDGGLIAGKQRARFRKTVA